jgi:hypothetical protein
MSVKKISQLPAGTAEANAVVPATNAAGTATEKITLGDIAALAPVSSVNGQTGAVTIDAVSSTDERLADAREPLPHKTSHAIGGEDELSPADIGASPAYDQSLNTTDSVQFAGVSLGEDGAVVFQNTASLSAGSFDSGIGGSGGISLNCVANIELNWQAGHLKSTADGGLTSSPIYLDSSLELPGVGEDYMEVSSVGLTFPDGTTQNTAAVLSDPRWDLFLPPAPTSVAVTPSGSQALVTWVAPAVAAQTPITDYQIQYSTDSGTTWTTFSDGTSTSAQATVTGLDDGSYQFRVRAVNAIGSGAWSSAVAASISSQDVYGEYVSLLLHMDGTNGSTSFADSSLPPKIVTANGDAAISTAQSKFGGASAYFDGNGDYISFDDPGLGTGDFTIEFWFKAASNAGYPTAVSNQTGAGQGFSLLFNDPSAGNLSFYHGVGGSNVLSLTASGTWDDNEWHHWALVRDGSNCAMYLDGVLADDATCSDSFTNGDWHVGADSFFSGRDFNGYIDDLRITKGVARYTSNFTPLMSPFLNPEVNPSLLLHFDGSNGSTTFTDSSLNGLTVTASGDAAISTAQSKFGGASAYFDGVGDHLEVDSSALAFGTGDFTAEAWIRLDAGNSTFRHVFDTRTSDSTGLSLGVDDQNQVFLYSVDAFRVQAGTVSGDTWHHLALCRAGGNVRVFLDGTQVGSTWVDSTNYSQTLLRIGKYYASGLYQWQGYLDDVRITKGVARYTSNFTPPTAAFPEPWVTPSLLLHFDGANGSTTFTDLSLYGLTVTAFGDAEISTAQSKFGGASAYFDGNASTYLSLPANTLSLGTGDFTIEMWARFADPTQYQYFMASDEMDGGYFQMALNGMDTNAIGIGRTNVDWPLVWVGHNMVADTWHHVAVCRAGGVARCFVDGVQIGSGITDSTDLIVGPSELHIGHQAVIGTMTGYLDELRILKGYAAYTANFTPPTAPFDNP